MKLTHQAIRFVLLAAMGCSAGDDRTADKPRITNSSESYSPEPPWLFPTTSYSSTTDGPSEEDRLEIQIAADGHLTVGLAGSRVDATLDEIDRRLQEKKDGDTFKEGLLVSRPIVAIEVAPRTPWYHVLSVMRLCEVWRHRRVFVSVGSHRVRFHLPPNTTQQCPPMPDEARVRVALRLAHGTSTTTVRLCNRWSDLESFRTRIGDIAKQVTEVPAVAILDIGRDVPSDDVARFFEILFEADIRRFMYKRGMPPG